MFFEGDFTAGDKDANDTDDDAIIDVVENDVEEQIED